MSDEMGVIDLRSDTITTPTEEMRRAMVDAPVGDDVYGEDPTVNELERRTAELLGHEAGLFCATGSLANLLGVWLVTPPGAEIICDPQAHIVRAEMGAHGLLHGVTTRTWATTPALDPDEVMGFVAPDNGPFLVRTGAIEVENTHNFGGGTVAPIDRLRALSERARSAGLGLHLDGARLWNAHVATGVGLREYGELFDTVTVCYSKGLGAPVGSVLVGSADAIARARVERKRLGGGWRQAGILAAACLYALDHHVDRLADDHAGAKAIATRVAAAHPGAVDPAAVETNIVVITTGRPAGEVVVDVAEAGVRISAVGARAVRAVTHLNVTVAQCESAGTTLAALLAGDDGVAY